MTKALARLGSYWSHINTRGLIGKATCILVCLYPDPQHHDSDVYAQIIPKPLNTTTIMTKFTGSLKHFGVVARAYALFVRIRSEFRTEFRYASPTIKLR